jgi:hypothetical protein
MDAIEVADGQDGSTVRGLCETAIDEHRAAREGQRTRDYSGISPA